MVILVKRQNHKGGLQSTSPTNPEVLDDALHTQRPKLKHTNSINTSKYEPLARISTTHPAAVNMTSGMFVTFISGKRKSYFFQKI